MSWRRIFYLLLVVIIAGVSALAGGVAGGMAVYQVMRQYQPVSGSPALATEAIPATAESKAQPIEINTTDIETTITNAVQQVGAMVVTGVGTIPGRVTFFGQTGDHTVSGSGEVISTE